MMCVPAGEAKDDMHGLGHNAPDAADTFQVFLLRGHQAVDVAEVTGQDVGHVHADMLNRQPRQQAAQGAAFALVDRLEQVVDTLFADAFQLQQAADPVGLVQPVDVREVLDQPAVDELIDQGGAQILDVHLVAAGEEPQPLLQLRRALGVHAPNVDALFFAGGDGTAAIRALRRGAGFAWRPSGVSSHRPAPPAG